LIFQGHDTTSVGICWALFMIGLHDEVQARIYEEMQEIFGDDKDRPATIRDLNEMKYLERVLKETLRLYPSVPNISRKMNEDIEIGENWISASCDERGDCECQRLEPLYCLVKLRTPVNPPRGEVYGRETHPARMTSA
jgi:Cytochrome P450